MSECEQPVQGCSTNEARDKDVCFSNHSEPTTRTYPDLRNWVFEIDEVSAGVYEVVARDNAGQEVSDKGIDVAAIIETCKEQAKEFVLRK
jgi:hypothetical protein